MSPRPWKELEKDENRIEKCENWIKMKEVQQKKRQVHTLDPASWTEWTEDEICSRKLEYPHFWHPPHGEDLGPPGTGAQGR